MLNIINLNSIIAFNLHEQNYKFNFHAMHVPNLFTRYFGFYVVSQGPQEVWNDIPVIRPIDTAT